MALRRGDRSGCRRAVAERRNAAGSRRRRRDPRHRAQRCRTRGRGLGDRRHLRPGNGIPEDRGHRRTMAGSSCRICRMPPTRYGPAAMASSTRSPPPRGRATRSSCRPPSRPIPATPRPSIPPTDWYALLEVPDAGEFPGTGPRGNGISRQMRNQAEWVDRLKDGCQLCHQMGNLATREVPNLDDYDSTLHAWEQRVLIGATGAGMNAGIDRMGRERSLAAFASWTDRIMDGAVPPTPPRPAGAERNVVLTQWGWSSERAASSTTRSRPTSATPPSTPTDRSTASTCWASWPWPILRATWRSSSTSRPGPRWTAAAPATAPRRSRRCRRPTGATRSSSGPAPPIRTTR